MHCSSSWGGTAVAAPTWGVKTADLNFALQVGTENARVFVTLAGKDYSAAGTGDATTLDRLLQVVLLADIPEHGNDLVEAVVLFQPADRAGGVQPTGIAKDRSPTHLISSSRS